MKKYLQMSSASVVIGALRVKSIFKELESWLSSSLLFWLDKIS